MEGPTPEFDSIARRLDAAITKTKRNVSKLQAIQRRRLDRGLHHWLSPGGPLMGRFTMREGEAITAPMEAFSVRRC
jgi:hypothetical protein